MMGISSPTDSIPQTTTLKAAEVRADKVNSGITRIQAKSLTGAALAGESVEGLIRTLSGVVATDELSSQYAVRGGSFDENLLLIEGFEVYRPQLARSGQQEGLSAINPDLVGNLEFSAGGFSVLYGDKLSSVLSVRYQPTAFNLPEGQAQWKVKTGLYASRLAHAGYWDSHGLQWLSLLGIRVKSNRRFQQGLDTEGDYLSHAEDVQWLIKGHSKQWTHTGFAMAQNSAYSLQPSSRTTEFGTVTQVLRLSVYMAGKESYDYQNAFTGWRSSYQLAEGHQLSAQFSATQALESESADVESAYLLGEVNQNLGSDQFGDIAYWRGSGGHFRHARNHQWMRSLQASLGGYHKLNDRQTLTWGTGWQQQTGLDHLDEWVNLDSAGYSLPYTATLVTDSGWIGTQNLDLHQRFRANGLLNNDKLNAFVNYTVKGQQGEASMGLRLLHDSRSGEWRLSPRIALSSTLRDDWSLDLRGGSYAQTASVRELRNWRDLSFDASAPMQHAWHGIIGLEKHFERQSRPFYWRSEAYVKYLDKAFPFEQDGMRLRYLGTTPIQAKVIGIDQRLHTEWVDGAESWFSLSFYRSSEKVNDQWQRRASDYRHAMSLRVEDQLPDEPGSRVYVQIQYSGGFPFGAPLATEKPFSSSAYRRLDLGFERLLHVQGFQRVSIILEAFNLLEIRNTASYFWIMDISTANQYAVPNYLSDRLMNLSLQVSF